MVAVIWITLEFKTFQILFVKNKKENNAKCAHLITQVRVATVKSACKKSWAHSEIWLTDQVPSLATTHPTKTMINQAVVDGKSIQFR